jgi:outer membrane protein TolC
MCCAEMALKDRPLLASLRAQQQAQTSLAQAARSVMLPSRSLLVGGGLSGDRLAAPVLSHGGRLAGSVGSLGLPNVQQSGVAAESFYNWGAAFLLRQPLYDGGRAQSGAAVAERELDLDLLVGDTNQARRRIRDTVSASWSSLQSSDTVLNAARAGVVAGERALRDAQLRCRALVEPLTEVLLVQRDLRSWCPRGGDFRAPLNRLIKCTELHRSSARAAWHPDSLLPEPQTDPGR